MGGNAYVPDSVNDLIKSIFGDETIEENQTLILQ